MAWYEKNKSRKSLLSLNSSCDEENFSELGLAVPEEGGVCSLLLTEKTKASSKSKPSRRPVLGRAWNGKNKSMKTLLLKTSNSHTALRSDVGNDNGISTSTSDSEDARNGKNYRTIRIEKIPPSINICQLREVVSVFGEISSSYMKKDSNDSFQSCHIEFKRVKSRRRAIAAEGITVNNVHLPISDFHFEWNITIRISNISMSTTETSVYSICKECGTVERLTRMKNRVVDVFFKVKDTSTRNNIIIKLNDTLIDGCRWTAKLVKGPSTTSETINTTNGNTDTDIRANSRFTTLLLDIRNEFNMKEIYLTDLENLHHSLMHLRDSAA